MQDFKNIKTEAVASIIRGQHKENIFSILVVGCGDGVEAAVLSQQLGAKVTGIDIVDNFNEDAARCVTLQQGDATALDFSNETFNFVYSYHALEHIQDPQSALKEINRVLKKGGGYWIGTPNRSRLIGYIGSVGVPFQTKIKWNVADWKARARGRFKNELGAHAGFSLGELRALLGGVFPTVHDMTILYFFLLYPQYKGLLKWANYFGLSSIVYPSIYFYGSK